MSLCLWIDIWLAATRSLRSGARAPPESRAPLRRLRVAANRRMQDMIVGYHIIFGAYGFWLPNDPRGSWSDFVGSWELFRYGPATKTNATRSVAGHKHDVAARLAARQGLKFPAVQFSGAQARAVGVGFGQYIHKSGLVVRACAILPEHVH